jgi:hypothetical protein
MCAQITSHENEQERSPAAEVKIGYGAATARRPLGRRVAHWGGGGGSMSYVDLDARMSFDFTPNRWITGPYEQARSVNVLKAVYRCLASIDR